MGRNIFRQANRQARGIACHDLSKGYLGQFLRISEYNGDYDGADLLCEQMDTGFLEAKRARVQCKTLSAGNRCYIENEYFISENGPREDFYLIIYVQDRNMFYFLTAEDLMSLPAGPRNNTRFTAPKNDEYKKFTLDDWEKVVNVIKRGIDKIDAKINDRYLQEFLHPLQMRASHQFRDQGGEYLLTRAILSPKSDTTELSEIALVVARSRDSSVERVIDARWDLFKSKATWEWGYLGEGPKITAWSILGHYFGGVSPTPEQFRRFLGNCISRLDRKNNVTITAQQIDESISMPWVEIVRSIPQSELTPFIFDTRKKND